MGNDQHDDAPLGIPTVIRSRAAATVEEAGRQILYGGSQGRRNRTVRNPPQLVCLARSSLHDHSAMVEQQADEVVKRLRECRDDLASPVGRNQNPDAHVCAALRAPTLGWTGHVC